MRKIVVADTGPLIALALVELLPVLPKLFSMVYVTNGVISEATQDPTKPGAKQILNALENRLIVKHEIKMSDVYMDLVDLLDQGEAEALALAEQLNAVVLIDEKRGRKVAVKRGITITGTAAILIGAKRIGKIETVAPFLDSLARNGYRLSPSLLDAVLRLADESPNALTDEKNNAP